MTNRLVVTAYLLAAECLLGFGPGPTPHVNVPSTLAPSRLSQLERLSKMSPADRRVVLSALPAQKRMQVESILNRLDTLPPRERQQLLDRYRLFEQLDPKRKEEVRQGVLRYRALPEARRAAVKKEWDALKDLSKGERETRFNSREFKQKYSPAEREIIQLESPVLPD